MKFERRVFLVLKWKYICGFQDRGNSYFLDYGRYMMKKDDRKRRF